MPAILVEGLGKAYGAIVAVDDISLSLSAGEVLGLLGPNGAGKTTTIEMIAGLVEPGSGRIEIGGIDARALPRAVKAIIGVALQSTGLQAKITPREALRHFGAFYDAPLEPGALLDRFGLAAKADAHVDTLSGGQKQRLALALAFVNDPAVLILDEPTAGLDAVIRCEIHDDIAAMKREGRAVLMATHDMAEAVRLCDRVVVMAEGRIVAEGSPAELIAGSGAAMGVTVRTSAPVDDMMSERLYDLPGLTVDGDGLRFTTLDFHRSLATLIAALGDTAIRITGIETSAATLEDLIVTLTCGDAS